MKTLDKMEQDVLAGFEDYRALQAAGLEKAREIEQEISRLEQVAADPVVTLEELPHPLGCNRTHLAKVRGLDNAGILCDESGMCNAMAPHFLGGYRPEHVTVVDRAREETAKRIRRLRLEQRIATGQADN